jgi:hypothetical protein
MPCTTQGVVVQDRRGRALLCLYARDQTSPQDEEHPERLHSSLSGRRPHWRKWDGNGPGLLDVLRSIGHAVTDIKLPARDDDPV